MLCQSIDNTLPVRSGCHIQFALAYSGVDSSRLRQGLKRKADEIPSPILSSEVPDLKPLKREYVLQGNKLLPAKTAEECERILKNMDALQEVAVNSDANNNRNGGKDDEV